MRGRRRGSKGRGKGGGGEEKEREAHNHTNPPTHPLLITYVGMHTHTCTHTYTYYTHHTPHMQMHLCNGNNESLHSVQHTVNPVRVASDCLQLRPKDVVELLNGLCVRTCVRVYVVCTVCV